MKVFVKISEHKTGNTARVYPLIDWIKQSFTWIMRLGCVLIIHSDNLTFKALLWRVTRARIKTQHSVFVTRALMINSPISLGREDWTGVDQGCCCCWIWITGKKLRVIFYQIWTANQSVWCDHVRCESVSEPERDVFAGLVMVLDKNLPWLIYKSPHSLFRNHWKIYHHPVKPQGRWPFQSYFGFYKSLDTQNAKSTTENIQIDLNKCSSKCCQFNVLSWMFTSWKLVLLHPNWVVGLNFKGV